MAAIVYKTPSQIADQYLRMVQSLKPEVNTAQTDSDWWVRSRAVGGVVGGINADLIKIANDAFPTSARREALEEHLKFYFGSGFKPASVSDGHVLVTGDPGSSVSSGQNFQYDANGNLYAATANVNFGAAPSAIVPVQSIATGQNQNLLEGAILSIPSPPAGVDPTATVYGGDIRDGRDVETDDEAALRILLQVRTPIAGGKVSDYQQYALAADPRVVAASILRYPFGLGTVGVVITAGTTDIDTALNHGDPIVLEPSDELVAVVQAYVDAQAPDTDCPTVMGAASVPIDATIRIRFLSGSSSTLLDDPLNPGQQMTQAQFVQREAQRAIWKTPPGGRIFAASGYVLASEIEQQIDANLSAKDDPIGAILQIVVDRQCEDLSATGANRSLLGNQFPVPNIITILEIT